MPTQPARLDVLMFIAMFASILALRKNIDRIGDPTI